jgi:hypothetical protein
MKPTKNTTRAPEAGAEASAARLTGLFMLAAFAGDLNRHRQIF